MLSLELSYSEDKFMKVSYSAVKFMSVSYSNVEVVNVQKQCKFHDIVVQ